MRTFSSPTAGGVRALTALIQAEKSPESTGAPLNSTVGVEGYVLTSVSVTPDGATVSVHSTSATLVEVQRIGGTVTPFRSFTTFWPVTAMLVVGATAVTKLNSGD